MITKERVQAAIKYMISSGFAENQKDLAEKIGFNATNLSQAKKGDERYLTEGLAQRLSTNNSGINLSWLLTGEGEMLNTEGSSTALAAVVPQDEKELNDDNAIKWYYELDASAGDSLFDNNEMMAPFRYIQVPGFERCIGLNLTGNSMLNTAQSGDIVVVHPREVQTIINGEIYLVVTRDSQRMVKRLVTSGYTEDAIITCISDNPDKNLYADMKIQASLVHKIFRVAGFVSIKRMA
mgnify:FL=1